MLVIDVFACEDGQAQERVMRGRLLATVISRDLWIADRKFCTLGLLFGLQGREADFAIRPHGNLPWLPITEFCSAGQTETGAVFEQTVQLILHETLPVTLRRIVVRLKHPTRDGDRTLAVLSNLPAADASAVKIASLYQKRWRLERLFQVLEPCCHGEINPLAYPRAALLGFCMVLISDNLLAVLKAAMRRVHGADKIEASISHDYLADEIRRV